MLKASYTKYSLHFKEPVGTSRGVMRDKSTYFIRIWNDVNPAVIGVGECALFIGLSDDDRPDYEEQLQLVCDRIDSIQLQELNAWSSIRFGVEMAKRNLLYGGDIYFPSSFTAGSQSIEINGLIWMGSRETMLERIQQKLEDGFRCLKLKIGAIDFDAELSLLSYIRQRFSRDELELRVDANGAFTPSEAMAKLRALASFDLHSIEQPIRQGAWKEMATLCQSSPIPIALDEELIGVNEWVKKQELLERIQPQYIILKPALCGGFEGAEEWIQLAEERNIGWWVTSALESNVGLNAIAQWVSTLPITMPQGLGTGQLYTNNTPTCLVQKGCKLSIKIV